MPQNDQTEQTHQRYAVSLALGALRKAGHDGRKLAKSIEAMMKGKFRARVQYYGILSALIPVQATDVREPLLAAWKRCAMEQWFKLEDTPREELVH